MNRVVTHVDWPHSTKSKSIFCETHHCQTLRNYIAQPTLSLSASATLVNGNLKGGMLITPLSLRKRSRRTAGRINPVALKKGSLVEIHLKGRKQGHLGVGGSNHRGANRFRTNGSYDFAGNGRKTLHVNRVADSNLLDESLR